MADVSLRALWRAGTRLLGGGGAAGRRYRSSQSSSSLEERDVGKAGKRSLMGRLTGDLAGTPSPAASSAGPRSRRWAVSGAGRGAAPTMGERQIKP